jgi:hypothetical protein
MKVLLFDSNFQCFSCLSPKHVTEKLLQSVKNLGGSFLHVPIEYSALISGQSQENALNAIMRDLDKF